MKKLNRSDEIKKNETNKFCKMGSKATHHLYHFNQSTKSSKYIQLVLNTKKTTKQAQNPKKN